MSIASTDALCAHCHWLLRGAAALCLLGTTSSFDHAMAADWPVLRGSLVPTGYSRWDGWQLGAQFGVANMNTDFGNGTGPLVAFILRNSTLENEAAPSTWTTLPKDRSNSQVYGAFLGYNIQYSELVLGADLAYKHPTNLDTFAGDRIDRIVTTSDSVQHQVTIIAQSMLKLVDYATLRARAGYAVGQFLPYATVGFAVGRFNYATEVSFSDLQTQLPNPPGPVLGTFAQTGSEGQDNVIVGGVTVGLGMDVAIMPNMFLRAEWEYIAFGPVAGIRSQINTGQVGLGMRF
jgi:outer membrane immunogenic protein